MKLSNYNVNRQLQTLIHQEGLSLEEASQALGIDIASAELILGASIREETSLQQLVERYRPVAVEVLADIMQTGENESARVKAAGLILEGKGVIPDVNVVDLSQRFEKMKRAIGIVADNTKVVDTKLLVNE